MKATRVCSVDDCTFDGQLRRGMCDTHYRQMVRRGPLPPIPPLTTRCSVDGCERGVRFVLGMCMVHHARMRHRGTTEPPSLRPVSERFWARIVDQPNGCREWTGGATSAGYGTVWFDGKVVLTHRLAWELINGPIPDGMFVCHKCDNPPCCNVEEHLFLGTATDNMRDMIAKGRGRYGASL